MWMRSRFSFRGATASGVTRKARAPPAVVRSNRTLRRAHKAGRRATAAAAAESTRAFQPSAVVGRSLQIGFSGAPISVRISGLTVVGTGAGDRSAIDEPPGKPAASRLDDHLAG